MEPSPLCLICSSPLSDKASSESSRVGSDEVCAMRQKISSLDAADQELLFLHFSEKKRYEEIAEITGNNLPTTAKLIAAAVQRLNDLGGVA